MVGCLAPGVGLFGRLKELGRREASDQERGDSEIACAVYAAGRAGGGGDVIFER